MGAIGGLLSGHQGDMHGVSLDPNAFKIPDADKYRGQAETQYNNAISRADYVRPKQQTFLDSLEQQANGQGPSLAAEQLKQAQNRNLAQQIAAAQGSRGVNPALQQRQMFQNQMQTGAQLAGVGAQARMQEQLNARNLYGNQLNTMGSQADALVQNYLSQGFSMAQAQQQAAQAFQDMSMRQQMGLNQINSGIQSQNHKDDISGFNSIMSAGSDALTSLMGGSGGGVSKISSTENPKQLGSFESLAGLLSDKTQKKNIKKADKDIKNFLDKLNEHSYEYKDSNLSGAASGKRYGIIAQDLEKSEAGKSIVRQTSQGKMIDTNQGLGLVLAAQANLNKRISNIESKKV